MDLLILAGLLSAGLFLLLPRPAIRKCKSGAKIPRYRLIYSDQKTDKKDPGVIYSKILTSEAFNLYGKPDYVFKHKMKNSYIPVELKSGRIGDAALPREGDLLQLAAYFLIVAEHFGGKVPEGRLIYSDAAFIVKNRKHLRKHILRTVNDMRAMLCHAGSEAAPGFAQCRHCICNGTVCEIRSG